MPMLLAGDTWTLQMYSLNNKALHVLKFLTRLSEPNLVSEWRSSNSYSFLSFSVFILLHDSVLMGFLSSNPYCF